MYLSRIKLDSAQKDTMRALASPSMFHGAIEHAAGDDRSRKLWRIDTLRGELYLLVLSEHPLDFQNIQEQFGATDEEGLCKSYESLLQRVKNGTSWQFRLVANPVIKKKREGERGKVMPHVTTAYQEKWLFDRSEKNGFLVDEESFQVVSSKSYRFYKKDRNQVKLLSVTYEGILTVTDETLFKHMLTHGIGREKAYGQGMMTIMSRG